jgi:hypothetical protein
MNTSANFFNQFWLNLTNYFRSFLYIDGMNIIVTKFSKFNSVKYEKFVKTFLRNFIRKFNLRKEQVRILL